jgi:pyruvate-ferredoxin/flavodoxin oxidoreductase
MAQPTSIMIDGNEAAAHVAYRTSEVIAIYPITPSSPMSEAADQWQVEGVTNLWGATPLVQQMQSEGGAAGALHGALQTGALATTFTSSQGLLLMIPNMFKIAGELTSTVFHVAARSVATSSLSIFGDHSDVMAVRSTGWAMLFAASVQEAHDFALISQAATLRARVPFLHVLDGFRTSHEISKIQRLPDAVLREMVDDALVRAHRARALTPDRPFVRGTTQNPDTFFQAREAVNPYYQAVPELAQEAMNRFAALTGRAYRIFDYTGAPDAEHVIVLMGSGAETAVETSAALNAAGAKTGVLTVRLYRPFSARAFVDALPRGVRTIAALDRTKEPGALGEPLYQDVVTALSEAWPDVALRPRVIGGRYGLSSKEFTPAMVKRVFDELTAAAPLNHFTIGIDDDVSGRSLPHSPDFRIEPPDSVRAVFWGLGSDGTVGANKNTIKIIGEETALFAQGYFVYDSKKAGARTISHLRFGPQPIRAPYLIEQADFVGVHQFDFLSRYDVLACAEIGATVLLNCPVAPADAWAALPAKVRRAIRDKRLRVYLIDGAAVARAAGMANRVNTVMQTCFFALSGVLPRDEAIAQIKRAIQKSYGKRGEVVVRQNFAAVDAALSALNELRIPAGHDPEPQTTRAPATPAFVAAVTLPMLAGHGDALPVSALPADGTFPSATAQYEKRNLADSVPVWDPAICIQCGKCVLVCPHAVIRAKVFETHGGAQPPATFKDAPARWKELPDARYALQVSVEDCTGCALCVEACPVKDKSNASRRAINMAPVAPLHEAEIDNWAHFLTLPDVSRARADLRFNSVKNVQLLRPLFEFSGACAGCGETPYLKLLSKLFGDRSVIANATGCSSIYGGNLPTTPWAVDAHGRGPAWSNSLFEDNAEFGLGMRLSLDVQHSHARRLAAKLRGRIDPALVDGLLDAQQASEPEIDAQRARVAMVKSALRRMNGDTEAADLLALADALVRRSVWVVGGDGWAYDIGCGGLDHVLASGANVNVLVLDTEVYSNTGGQRSKATPLGAVAKFAAAGKTTPKKDLGELAMSYGGVYVAQVAMGADDAQTVRAFLEAEAHVGPSLIIAYSHCIAHGIDMTRGMHQQKLAADSGYWPLYRFDPGNAPVGQGVFHLDSKAPRIAFKEYAMTEMRYRLLAQHDPAVADAAMSEAQQRIDARWRELEKRSSAHVA